ncbi:MAG: DJ-1/PfpI family protein [Acidobacteria bacterium]|nr:DJ-1/PfpI family protein [Acidobacteriota bacterium]
MKKVAVLLADGFEEIEAITSIDLLRRAGAQVTTVSITHRTVLGAHGVHVIADGLLDDVTASDWDMLVLPGGMPGAKHLRENGRVIELVRQVHESGKWVAAICAAPMVLAEAGILAGRMATCYTGFLDEFPSVKRVDKPIVTDQNLITARGPGVALDFALMLIEKLLGESTRKKVEEPLLRPVA